jgi:hypothetical protein
VRVHRIPRLWASVFLYTSLHTPVKSFCNKLLWFGSVIRKRRAQERRPCNIRTIGAMRTGFSMPER